VGFLLLADYIASFRARSFKITYGRTKRPLFFYEVMKFASSRLQSLKGKKPHTNSKVKLCNDWKDDRCKTFFSYFRRY